MENQMEKKTDNEMETREYIGVIPIVVSLLLSRMTARERR